MAALACKKATHQREAQTVALKDGLVQLGDLTCEET